MPRLSPSLLRKILIAAGLCLGVVWAAVGHIGYGGAYHVPALWLLLAAALVLALRAVRRQWLAVAAAGLCLAAIPCPAPRGRSRRAVRGEGGIAAFMRRI